MNFFWTPILFFLDVSECLNLSKISKPFQKHIQTEGQDIIKNYISQEIQGFEIISEVDDTRDCSGTSGLIFFLKNGDILSDIEYEMYCQDYKDQIKIDFKYVLDSCILDNLVSKSPTNSFK